MEQSCTLHPSPSVLVNRQNAMQFRKKVRKRKHCRQVCAIDSMSPNTAIAWGNQRNSITRHNRDNSITRHNRDNSITCHNRDNSITCHNRDNSITRHNRDNCTQQTRLRKTTEWRQRSIGVALLSLVRTFETLVRGEGV